MRLKRKAWKYARALFRASEALDAVSEVGHGMEVLHHLLKTDAVFRAFFHTRKLTPLNKREILETILGAELHILNIEFMVMLAERREWLLFVDVAKGFRELKVRSGNEVNVVATTAVPLEGDELKLVKDTLAQATGKDLKLSAIVNPEILGGIRLRVGNLFIDGSLQSSLVRMRRQLIES